MPCTLHTSLRSPYARKVRIVMLEKELPFELSIVDLSARPAWFAELSPLGKVPVLVDDDGTRVFDSSVIVEYLEDRHPRPPMLGEGWRQRLRHRSLDELGDFVADQAVVAFQARDRGEAAGAALALERVGRALDAAQARLGTDEGPSAFGVGDAAVISAVGYFVLRHGDAMIRERARLAAWLEAQHARPSVASTVPPTIT